MTGKNRIKAVIFDMGGVILRTEDPGAREAIARRFGTTRSELEERLFLGPSAVETEVGLITEEEHLRTVLEYYGQPGGNHKQLYTEFFSGDVLDEKLIDHVQSLKKTYKVGLLSNAWMNIRKNLSAWHGFVDVFDVSIFSSEVGLRKPDERIFRMILDRLGVEAQEAVFIDDFAENIAGADKLGIHTIQFKNREQAIAELSRLLEDQDPK